MKRTLTLALAGSLFLAPVLIAQAPPEGTDISREPDRVTLEDPRIGAEVRTAAGDLVGRVARLEFETEVQTVVEGYLVAVSDLAGREARNVYFADEQAVWTDLAGTPVLQLTVPRSEIEAMPSFADERPAAFEFDDRWTGDVDVEIARLLQNPDAASPNPGGPDRLLGPDELDIAIEWTSDFDAGEIARQDWNMMTAFTPNGDPFGVVREVLPGEGEPQRLVVQLLPEYYDRGVLLEFEIAEIEAISQSGTSFKIDIAAGQTH